MSINGMSTDQTHVNVFAKGPLASNMLIFRAGEHAW